MSARLRHRDTVPARRRSSRTGVTVLAAAAVTAVLPATLLVTPASAASASDISAFDAVDQFIGTELDTTENKSNDAYGNTFPGAAVPFGLVQSSPTTYREGDNGEKGGYEYTGDRIRGFGLTRLSGTGCTGAYGGFDVPILPFTGDLTESGALPSNPQSSIRDYYLPFSHENETAQPGYYKVVTDNGVATELTAATHSAVSSFDFPHRDDATLLIDVAGSNNGIAASDVHVDAAARTVSGTVTAAAVCNQGKSYTVHFSATFDQPIVSSGVWGDGAVTPGGTAAAGTTAKHGTGAYLTFAPGAKVVAKIGISYTSVENAELNRATEVDGKSFSTVRAQARSTWVDALGTVDATGGTQEQRVKLYTALYHAMLHPNVFDDVNGEYVGYDGQVHQVEAGRHFYVNFQGWDFYRSQAQLLALTHPKVAADVAESIVLMTKQTGTWVDGPTYNIAQARMAADSLPVALASIDDFGITDYDRQGALDSLLATQVLPGDRSTRPDAYQYFATGIVENSKGNFATARVLEYSVEDFAISELAQRLGDDEAHDRFASRSQSWQNVFDFETDHIRPRSRNGFDRGFDLRGRDGAGGGQFNQATGYQYGWMVPHNLGALIADRGGFEAADQALDVLMADLDAGAYTQTGNYLSNQPTFNSPWVYNWIGKPEKTTDVLYRAVDLYDTTPAGLPGNDDLGSLSSWYVWANLGIYPAVYGTADMIVTAPMFPQITITAAGSDRVYRINAPGAGTTARYTTALSVDGVPQTASWVDAERFAQTGGTLDFTLAATPGSWGSGADDLPPSYGEGMDARNNIGITSNGKGNLGSMDLSDWSLSREKLAAAGATPGARLPLGDTGLSFTWPDVEEGEPDNWIVAGQRLEVPDGQGTQISFLGLATNGPASGTAYVEYTDGTRQPVDVTFTDWAAAPAAGNTTVVETVGRNNRNGSTDNLTTRVFATTPVALDPTKVVDAVVLPEVTDKGIMHVFDVATDVLPLAGSDTQNVQVTVPEPGTGGPGELVWGIDGTNGLVDLGTAVQDGDRFRAAGSINPVRVTDTRPAGAVWSISGQVSDFVAGGESFSGEHLGWTPRVTEAGGGAQAGDAVASVLDGGPGLAGSATLGSAPEGHETGSARLGAGLDLTVPVDVAEGTYTATLTLTALA